MNTRQNKNKKSKTQKKKTKKQNKTEKHKKQYERRRARRQRGRAITMRRNKQEKYPRIEIRRPCKNDNNTNEKI